MPVLTLTVSRHFACYRFTSAPDGSFPRGLPHASPRSGTLTALGSTGPNFEVDPQKGLRPRFPRSRAAAQRAGFPALGRDGRRWPGAAASPSPRTERPERAGRLLPAGRGTQGPGGPVLAPLTCARGRAAAAAAPSSLPSRRTQEAYPAAAGPAPLARGIKRNTRGAPGRGLLSAACGARGEGARPPQSARPWRGAGALTAVPADRKSVV